MLKVFFSLWSLVFVVAATNCVVNGTAGGHGGIAGVELDRLQKEVPFQIVAPRYLPLGFGMTAVEGASPSEVDGPRVKMFFWNGDDRDIIIVTQSSRPVYSPFGPVYNPGAEKKEVKAVAVQVEQGYSRVSGPQGMEWRQAVNAYWNYKSNSFTVKANGVLWDEVEKIIASMIE
ncbi:MAG: hypothetical protein HY673_03405 [Chloroflexi bacterium]|nr:hypothetical protein [Chloroflexota bacterium]